MTGSRGAPARRAALEGLRDVAPIIAGMAPFGLLAGIAAVEAGLAPWGALAFSTLVFAGAAQLAALDLLAQDAGAVVAVGTIVVINARFVMYSASLAPHLAAEPPRRRALVAYLLTDQAYALAISRITRDPDLGERVAYFVGCGAPLWFGWQCYTVLGAVAGAALPEDLPIEFAIPLVFAALLVPAVTSRPTLVGAVTSAVVATAAADLPANLGLLAGVVCGVLAGWATSRAQAEEPDGGSAPVEVGAR